MCESRRRAVLAELACRSEDRLSSPTSASTRLTAARSRSTMTVRVSPQRARRACADARRRAGECKAHMMKYMQCLKKHGNSSIPCRVESGDYLECRMNWYVSVVCCAWLSERRGAAASWIATSGRTWVSRTSWRRRTRQQLQQGTRRRLSRQTQGRRMGSLERACPSAVRIRSARLRSWCPCPHSRSAGYVSITTYIMHTPLNYDCAHSAGSVSWLFSPTRHRRGPSLFSARLT